MASLTGSGSAGTDINLIPGRECGDCNVCCVALTIDDPALQKVQGYRCKNARKNNSCAIYESRPQACRDFFCGWRQLKWVRPTLRPDVAGVLVRLHKEISSETGAERMGVVFTLLNNAALKAEGLAESVAAAVSAGIPLFLHIPGPPGYTSGRARINEVLTEPVLNRDKAGVLKVLREARAMGRRGDHKPISLRSGTPAGDTL